MYHPHSTSYQKAFAHYLRCGVMRIPAKASAEAHPTTGNPGEDYGCRCTAEPYTPEVNESLSQSITSIVDEGLSRWAWYDFVLHYYWGAGKAVELSLVGQLQDVIDVSREHVFKRVERQVMRNARTVLSGNLDGIFKRSYPYYSVSIIHGDSTVEGRYSGSVSRMGNALHISAEVEYHFKDVFTDPLDLRERSGGTSDPRAIQADELIDGEFGGQFYDISGRWTTRLRAVIHMNPNKSIYRDE